VRNSIRRASDTLSREADGVPQARKAGSRSAGRERSGTHLPKLPNYLSLDRREHSHADCRPWKQGFDEAPNPALANRLTYSTAAQRLPSAWRPKRRLVRRTCSETWPSRRSELRSTKTTPTPASNRLAVNRNSSSKRVRPRRT